MAYKEMLKLVLVMTIEMDKLVWQHELWSDAPFLKAVSVALIIARQRHPGNFTQRFILSGLAQMKERH